MQALSTVGELPIGIPVSAIRRVFYAHGAEVFGDRGPLEISFTDGQIFVIDRDVTGERIRITSGPWKDHSDSPMTISYQEFVRKSGQWEVFDLSRNVWSYHELVGHALEKVSMATPDELELLINLTIVRARAIADDLFVDFRDA